MGGYGSGRWGWHTKKTQVEECLKWRISGLKGFLVPGSSGVTRWVRGEQVTDRIGFRVLGDDFPTALQVSYTIGPNSENPQEFDYRVNLTTTTLAWGSFRYWFMCPLQGCRKRVGCLYLPPGGKYFGCRHCYDLSYRSQQEGYIYRGLYENLAFGLQDKYPGATWKDVESVLDGNPSNRMKMLTIANMLNNWTEFDPYVDYLTAEALCSQSELSPEDLKQLETARLLVPDTKDGRYRPKLAGWGKKLAYLLEEGWTVEEIKGWSKVRWRSDNPRQWPPIE
ncbi:MAG: hypothetical protein JXA13_11040 [Anaerolineales bacterium]|nr:hypothetical protein [Anaerolineales bacterium]